MSIPKLFALTEKFLEANNVPADHGWSHAKTVARNAMLAVMEEGVTTDLSEDIVNAALLHDVDDRKFFTTTNYQNARALLIEARYDAERIERVVLMISLVSASAQGNSTVDSEGKKIPSTYLIPRDADRVEAIGAIGVERCYAYTVAQKRPIALASTPRPQSREELAMLDVAARFHQYVEQGRAGVASKTQSASMIDHFYDKLLAITELSSGNCYLNIIAEERQAVMENWLLEWCKAHPAGDVADLEESEKIWRA
jgi:uncharacterized protein